MIGFVVLSLLLETCSALGPVTSIFPVDFGGSSLNLLMPEAIEANIVSLVTDNGWNYKLSPRNIPGDVIVNIPVWISGSSYAPFGDGQTNARIQMPVSGWVPEHALDAPIVAWMVLNRNTSNVNYFNVLMSCQFGPSSFVNVINGGQTIPVPSIISSAITNFHAVRGNVCCAQPRSRLPILNFLCRALKVFQCVSFGGAVLGGFAV